VSRALLIAGAGGVGKTTLAAACAVTAARNGIDTLVLTVDPARRLADALGVADLGNEPTATPGQAGLHAAMLDPAASWEALIRRHADPASVDRLLGSRFFGAVAERFPAGASYAAAEEMAAHLDAADFELVVVDTPPSAGGIDFFKSPRQVRSLVGGRVLRWLTGARIPGRRRVYGVTARPVLKLADTVLGGPLLEDVAEFLLDLRTAYDGITRRAKVVERHFRRATTVVVTTADPTPVREAVRFFEELPEAAGPPAAVVFNRALPVEWMQHAGDGPGLLALWGSEAHRQADVRAELAGRYGTTAATLPWLAEAPTSIDRLAALLTRAEGLDLEALGIA
jgi:anion-transporting  ArsA/GET3 family ATPase